MSSAGFNGNLAIRKGNYYLLVARFLVEVKLDTSSYSLNFRLLRAGFVVADL